jgi:hypothetical protein
MAEPLKAEGNATVGTGDDGGRQAGNPASLMDSFAGAGGAKPAAEPGTGENAGGDGNAGSGAVQQTEGGSGEPPKLAAWAEQLPPELRGKPEVAKSLSKYAKVADVVNALLEAEGKLAGGGAPGADAKPEEVSSYWEKLGKPKTAEGYSFAKEPDAAPFARAAHTANLTASQAEALYTGLNELGRRQAEAAREALGRQVAEADAALKKEFGARYAEKINFFTAGCDAAGPGVRALLYRSGLGGNLDIIKAFIALGQVNAESGSPRGGGAAQPFKPVAEGGWWNY